MHDEETSGEVSVGMLSKPILVPLDGTDVAAGILPYVSQLARGADVPLMLHGVVDPGAIDYPGPVEGADPSASLVPGVYRPVIYDSEPPLPSSQAGIVYQDQIEANSLAHVEASLRKVAQGLDADGVKTKVKTSLGKPAIEILRVAEEEGCGLIAMSTHGRGSIGRSILGSVTDKVIHTSTVPVLTITPEKAKRYQEQEGDSLTTVMVPLDGSDLAELALPYAEELARSLSLELLLVRVVDPEYPAYTYGGYTGLNRSVRRMADEAATYLGGVVQSLASRGLDVQSRVIQGSPAHVLVSLAHETPHDVIAMTTHGRSGLLRWLTGSVTEAMIRASGDPVLVVRPQS